MLEVLEYVNRKPGGLTSKIINREISWLAFNARVLQEADDPKVPLFERFRFLGIFSNNLDEFFRVRVATVKRMVELKKSIRDHLNEDPKKVLAQIQETVLQQQKDFQAIYERLLAELMKEGIAILNEKQLNAEQEAFVKNYFLTKVWPVLIPIMVSTNKKFPYLRDKYIYLAIKLSKTRKPEDVQYSLIEIPADRLGRFLVLPNDGDKRCMIILDDVIRFCLKEVFSMLNYNDIKAYTIKITRDAELDIEHDVSKSFLDKLNKSIKDRKKGEPVRFVYDKTMDADLLHFIMRKMKLDKSDNLIPGGRYHNFKDFMGFPNLGRKDLEYPKIVSVPHSHLKPYKSILNEVRKRDILLHFPYQSFNYFIDLLREAAIDPSVKSIKVTVYRLAKDSRVANALINAARNGKQVTAVLELQARFDEEANIRWSSVLQEEGVNVLHGLPGLKVHSKMCLISRREGTRTRNYASLGTGNFNESTSKVYSDLMLFTSDNRLCDEANRLFKLLEETEIPKPMPYKHLLPSPMQLRSSLVAMINTEIKNAKSGKEAFIYLKMNSLVDPDLILKLYQASKVGVKIRLNIRGICSLKAGVAGLSDNIEAISIVDKFLEHARVFWFANGGEELIYVSSADWMGRNLDSRVEVTFPIYAPELKQEIRDFLEIQWADNTKARMLDDKQENNFRIVEADTKKVRCQFELYDYYKQKTGVKP